MKWTNKRRIAACDIKCKLGVIKLLYKHLTSWNYMFNIGDVGPLGHIHHPLESIAIWILIENGNGLCSAKCANAGPNGMERPLRILPTEYISGRRDVENNKSKLLCDSCIRFAIYKKWVNVSSFKNRWPFWASAYQGPTISISAVNSLSFPFLRNIECIYHFLNGNSVGVQQMCSSVGKRWSQMNKSWIHMNKFPLCGRLVSLLYSIWISDDVPHFVSILLCLRSCVIRSERINIAIFKWNHPSAIPTDAIERVCLWFHSLNKQQTTSPVPQLIYVLHNIEWKQ